MPPRLRDIARALVKLGGRVEEPKGGGSHWRAIGANGMTYPIPAHNGAKSEIDDKYVKGMCRALGLDEAELRGLL